MWEQITILLLIIGVLAIVLELIMPGFDSFISGIVGVLALIASAVLAVIFIEHGWIFVVANTGILAISVFALVKVLQRKKNLSQIILSENLNVHTSTVNLSQLIGKKGKTTTALRPYGEAVIDGQTIEVRSNGEMLESGTTVKVTDTSSNKVYVEKI